MPTTYRKLTIVFALLLAACGERFGIRDSKPVEPPKGMALVILGFSYTGALPRAADGGNPDCPAFNTLGRSRLTIDFARVVDPKDPKAGYEIALRDVVCAQLSPENPVRYSMFHVRPGTYTMTGVTAVDMGRRLETIIRNPLRFTVAEGELVYFGDLLAESLFPAKISYARSDATARRAFVNRGGSGPALAFRPMTAGGPGGSPKLEGQPK